MRRTLLTLALFLAVLPGSVAAAQQSATTARLLEQFKTLVFWRQLEIAKELAKIEDAKMLAALEPMLRDEDRHVRANAAFVFAARGDARGLETLTAIVADRSDRPLGQGIVGIVGSSFNTAMPLWWLPRQISADRYYAVHVMGELRNQSSVEILIPLLADREVNYHAAWALGQIRDSRAIAPLITMLGDRDAFVRVSAIQALEATGARQALPQLRALLNDGAIPTAGPQVTVSETAKAAIAKLQKEP